MSTPATDEQLAQQFVLFDLTSANVTASTTLLPQLADIPATPRGKATKRGAATPPTQTPAKAARPTLEPQRLEIPPAPVVPDLSPLLLDAVRAALFQALFQEAQAAFQTRLAEAPTDQPDGSLLAVEPARLGAAAQLLLDTPTLKAAVSLLALGASFQSQAGAEHTACEPETAP